MDHFQKHTHPQIDTLIPYQAGMNARALSHLDQNSIIKLASNENPLGVSPLAKQAMQNAIDDCAKYPENLNDTLNVLAKHLGINPNQCIIGNGSENIIAMLIQTFNNPKSHFLIPEFAFSAYRINAKAHNAAFQIVKCPEYKLDIEKLLSQVTDDTSLIFIDNPNNPVGHYLTHSEVEHILNSIPKSTLLVLDEAYYEYAMYQPDYPNSLELLKQHSNLVIIRTFSKIYGLAGLRIGYGMAHENIIELLNRVRFPFNVSSIALSAASASLNDKTFIEATYSLNQAGLAQFEQTFKSLKLETYPILGNFITVNLKQDSDEFFQFMLKHGIILRPLKAYNLPNHIRISSGTEKQTTHVNKIIRDYFTEKSS